LMVLNDINFAESISSWSSCSRRLATMRMSNESIPSSKNPTPSVISATGIPLSSETIAKAVPTFFEDLGPGLLGFGGGGGASDGVHDAAAGDGIDLVVGVVIGVVIGVGSGT
jgi:hypothetical protein